MTGAKRSKDMFKRVILENKAGKAVRVFACEGETAHLILLKDSKRLALANDLTCLDNQPFEQIAQVNFNQLKNRALSLAGFGQLRAVENVQQTIHDHREKIRTANKFFTGSLPNDHYYL